MIESLKHRVFSIEFLAEKFYSYNLAYVNNEKARKAEREASYCVVGPYFVDISNFNSIQIIVPDLNLEYN